MTPGGVHYSFVVDAHGAFAYQAYLLAHSLIRLGRVEPDQISAHFVSGTHEAVEDVFRDLGLRTNRVEPFGHPYCNRLQHLEYLRGVDAEQVVLLDTDMFMIRPLDLPEADAVWGKIVDLPNPPIEVLAGIFREAGLPLEHWASDVDGAPTSRGNFNGGLYVVPKALLEGISESWIRWARWSLDHMELFAAWGDNIDQVSFSLAVAELDLPVAALPRQYNLPTHLGPLPIDAPPFLLHYHRNVDDQFLLCPTGASEIDAFVEVANRAIVDWRREDIGNTLFWGARYALFPELGSGVGSRGLTLEAKRETIRRIIEVLSPQSVVDIGGGDGATLEGLADGLVHYVTDAAPGARQTYLERNPRATFVRSDITDEQAVTADLAVCLDVLIHVPDRERFERAVVNILASGRTAALVSGFDREPSAPGTLTYFHRPLIEALEANPDVVAYPVLAYNEITAYLVQRTSSPSLTVDLAAVQAQRPVVTVLVPAYQPNERFYGLMTSLAAQTYPYVLVRVSLDGDGQQEIPQIPDMRGKQVEWIRQPRRLGWVGNVNALLPTVTTPYFLLLMHDDQLSPRYIEAAVDVLERRREVVVAHGTVRYHGIRGGDIEATASNTGDLMARILAFLERQPHLAGAAWRGVVRSDLIAKGLRLRTRRSDGLFSDDLMALEMIVHGESAHLDDAYYDKYLDPEGLSRLYHGRSLEERSEMLGDSLASLVVMLGENGFGADDKVEIAARYAEWLLGLGGSWNTVSRGDSADDERFATVRPQVARFVANAAVSVAQASPMDSVRHRTAVPMPAADPPRSPSTRQRLRTAIRGSLMRLPAYLRGNPLCDAEWYRLQYPDVAHGRLRPYAHFRRHGVAEGRDPNEFFDTDWYLAHYPDVREAGIDPLDHYLRFGVDEGRNPGPEFDTAAYLDRYPDVSQSGMNPLLHYLRHGRGEGRSAAPGQPNGRV